MNAQRGSARAFARTVRDIVGWRGQRHTFFQYAAQLSELPSIAVFWGDRDSVIPPEHARALAEAVERSPRGLVRGLRALSFITKSPSGS
jgi:hypothetical protein